MTSWSYQGAPPPGPPPCRVGWGDVRTRPISCRDAPALLLGWRSQLQKKQVGVSKAILRSRNTAPPPQRR